MKSKGLAIGSKVIVSEYPSMYERHYEGKIDKIGGKFYYIFHVDNNKAYLMNRDTSFASYNGCDVLDTGTGKVDSLRWDCNDFYLYQKCVKFAVKNGIEVRDKEGYTTCQWLLQHVKKSRRLKKPSIF